MKALFLTKGWQRHAPLLCLIAPLIGAFYAFTGGYLASINVWVGLCLFPYALYFEGKMRLNRYYLLLVLVLGGLGHWYHVRMFYFGALGAFVLLVLEATMGKLNPLVLFLLVFMSPVFHQVAVIFGFPIRLQLSQWAGDLLRCAGWDLQVLGNVMVYNGASFSVDEACMGLNMMGVSLLMGVFMLAHRYRSKRDGLGLGPLLVFFLLVVALNIGANLVRIMLLVVFRIGTENPLHEGVGVLCLLGYVMWPLWLLSRRWVRIFGQSVPRVVPSTISFRVLGLLLPLSMLLLAIGYQIGRVRAQETVPHVSIHVPGLKETQLKEGITKLQNDSILLYVKPIPEFFTGEHNPLLCWEGSGYTFKSIRKSTFRGVEIYWGLLEKTGNQLYTAWWYDNGKVKTIEQWEWRVRMMKGEGKFCLFNLTANGEKELHQQLQVLLGMSLLTAQLGI